jgi:D-threo-aldose 1-dehydrogenase
VALPRGGLTVDVPLGPIPLVFGGAPIGGLYSPVTDQAAAGTLAAAWAAGIRAFDTAPHYGAGLSERRIGEFLTGRPRDEFTVSTKVGRRLVPANGDVHGDEGFHGTPPLSRVRDYSRDGVRRSLEESLGRLGLDRVDIALIHDPDDFMGQAADEAYPALAGLRAQGTVRAVGAGMNSAAALAWLVERCDLDCVLVAGRYTLLDQSAAEVLFPLCLRRGVAVLAGGVFNSGILTRPDDGATYDYAPASSAVLERARRMRDACAQHGVPLPAAALQFTLHHPAITAAVVGARTAEEITVDVSYLETHIPGALWAELNWARQCLPGSAARGASRLDGSPDPGTPTSQPPKRTQPYGPGSFPAPDR